MRGATRVGLLLLLAVLISIHAPHARSDTSYDAGLFTYLQISIHAPHARSDLGYLLESPAAYGISIHAPHARSDSRRHFLRRTAHNFNPRSSCEERRRLSRAGSSRSYDFNPRSSCEERRTWWDSAGRLSPFQSTLLMRGATAGRRDVQRQRPISIHAPHARSDYKLTHRSSESQTISIHAPHARSDGHGG